MKLDLEKARPIVEMALKEDVGPRDITTLLTILKGKRVKGVIRAKEGGVIAGVLVAKLVFETVDSKISFKIKVREGQKVKKGKVIAEVSGDARSILTGERTALNFLQRLSGIATLTDQFAEKVRPYKVKIFDTRKTTPNLRILEKYAVRCGRGHNHRMGLYDQVLIKDNHLRMIRGFSEVVRSIRKKIPKGMKIEVEAKTLRQVEDARRAGIDIIMLDNMTTERMKQAVKAIRARSKRTGSRIPLIEASGRITLKNVGEIARTGVDRISIGALTHSADTLDISLDIATAETQNGTEKRENTDDHR